MAGVVVGVAVVATLVVGAAVAASRQAGTPGAHPVATTSPEPPCAGPPPAIPAGAVAVSGDPTGAGCTVTVVWWPDRGELDRPEGSGPSRRFALGDPGDQVVLGDWDGDGRDTPALYDPRRGLVVRFDSWAEPGQTLTGSFDPAPAGGRAEVVRRDGGDTVDVRPG